MKNIVQVAKKSRGGNKIKTTNVTEARNAEKQNNNYENRLSAKPEFEGAIPKELPQPEPEEKPEEHDFTPYDNDEDMYD